MSAPALRRGPLRRAALWLLLPVALASIDRGLKAHYYSQSYRYYEAGEVYWEDSHTLLLFSPDRYLFWRLKPNIHMRLEETPEQYGAYVIGTLPVPYAFEVHTEGRGFNTPAFDCHAKAGVRVVTLGDSRTMAEGVPFEDVYARRLERLLRARSGNQQAEVLNGGVSGYSSYQGLVELERHFLACRPDVVTLLFGINDQDVDQGISDRGKAEFFDSAVTTLRAWANRSMLVYFVRREWWQLRARVVGKTPAQPVDYKRAGPRAARVSLDEYAQNLERIADLGRERGFKPVFAILPTSPYAYYPELFPDQATPNPVVSTRLDTAETLAQTDNDAAATQLRVLLSEHPQSSRARHLLGLCLQRQGRFEEAHALFVEANRAIVFSRYEDVVRRVAAARGVTLLDLTPEFTTLRPEPLYVDDMHPNALGHEIVARRLDEALAEAGALR